MKLVVHRSNNTFSRIPTKIWLIQKDLITYLCTIIYHIKLTALQHSVRTFQADSHGRLKGPALSQNIQRYIHMQDNNQEHTFTWIK